MSLKNVFKRWKVAADSIKVKTLEKQVEEATKRYVKVKALLQRQHQANQQNVEEKNMMKISQREALQELKSLKQREDHEKEALMETLRIQKIEAAFHNDLEILIQQKADELYSQQQTLREKEKELLEKKQMMMLASNTGGGANDKTQQERTESDRTSALYESREKELLEKVALLESTLESTQKDNEILKGATASLETSLGNAQVVVKEKEEDRKRLQRKLDDEERLREELEAELKMTLANQSAILDDMNKYTEVLVSKRCEDLTLENKNIRKQLEAALRELDATKNDSMGASSDVTSLRVANEELLRQCREVPRLEALIAELKNSQLLMQRSKQHDSDMSTSFMEVIDTGLAISNLCETYMASALSSQELLRTQCQQTKMLASGVVNTLQSVLGGGEDNVFAKKLTKIEQKISSLQSELEDSREDDDLIVKTQQFSLLLKQQAKLRVLVDHVNDLRHGFEKSEIMEYLKGDGQGGAQAKEGGQEDLVELARQQITRFQEVSSTFKSKLFHDLPSKMVDQGASSRSSQSHGLKMNTSGTIATYSGESIVVKPGDEFRIRIPPVAERPFMLSYQFCLPKDKQKNIDIGFAIVTEKADGSLPQISRYRRVRAQGESKQMVILPDNSNSPVVETIALVFDNTYSWTRAKEIRYEITLESLAPVEATDATLRQEQSDNAHCQHEEMILSAIVASVEKSLAVCTEAL